MRGGEFIIVNENGKNFIDLKSILIKQHNLIEIN